MIVLVSAAMALVAVCASACASGSSPPRPSSPAAAPRRDRWVTLGPGGGGAQFHPLWSPVDPSLILNATDMSEGFISEDGGDSWRMFNLRGHVRWFAFDPTDRGVMYCRTRGLFRSTDGGGTWQLVHPAPENVKGVSVLGDHAVEIFVTRDGRYDLVDALAVDPADGTHLHAVMRSGGRMHSAESLDWGRTWRLGEELPSARDYSDPLASGRWSIYVDPRSPLEGRTLYVIGENTVSVRERAAP